MLGRPPEADSTRTYVEGVIGQPDRVNPFFALPDTPGVASATRFGSAHSGGWYAVFCDGHVELVSFDIDLAVHKANANRADEGRPN